MDVFARMIGQDYISRRDRHLPLLDAYCFRDQRGNNEIHAAKKKKKQKEKAITLV